MGGDRKQFRLLGGESLLLRTVRLFDEHPRISEIIVAVPEADVDDLAATFSAHPFQKLHDVVAGGPSRQASVARCLEAAPRDTDIVLVHDAVRPFLPPDRIDAVIAAVETHGAAAPALPVSDTLRRGADGNFAEPVRRSGLFGMQTPQGFRLDWFAEAHAQAKRSGFETTDDVGLIQRIGRGVRIVEGSALNFKVTTAADWVLAQALWHFLATES